MNSFIELANYIQNGLNEVLSAALNGSDELQFRVWATAGERTPSVRDGNTVRYFIDGNLTSTSSSNEANILEMGFNGLSLSFGFPVQEPKTDAGQTAAALAKIQNSQYPFVDFIETRLSDGTYNTAVLTYRVGLGWDIEKEQRVFPLLFFALLPFDKFAACSVNIVIVCVLLRLGLPSGNNARDTIQENVLQITFRLVQTRLLLARQFGGMMPHENRGKRNVFRGFLFYFQSFFEPQSNLMTSDFR